MSRCISREGEYSDHVPGGPDNNGGEFVCTRCFAFDEEAAVAEVKRLRGPVQAIVDRAVADFLPDAAEGIGETDSTLEAWSASDGTYWLFVAESGDWTGWEPGVDGVWIKTPTEMRESYPNHPQNAGPSPGVDPRVEAVKKQLAWHFGTYGAGDASRVLAAADAAREAVGIVRVDTRDETLKQAVYDWITDGYATDDPELRHNVSLVFLALAAMAGE